MSWMQKIAVILEEASQAAGNLNVPGESLAQPGRNRRQWAR